MLVLHDPDTLLHSTVELLASKLIPALESPDRIRVIVSALGASSHELRTIHVDPKSTEFGSGSEFLADIITKTHDTGYIQHLQNAYTDWINAGLIKAEENILPECFRFATAHDPTPSRPPKDIFARAGFYAFDMTGLMSASYNSIRASANLAYQGTCLLFSPNTTKSTAATPDTILALTRPPGHHCNGHQAGGYCYINNAAIAVSTYHSLSPSPSTSTTTSTSKKPSEPRTAILDLDFHHGNGTQDLFYSSPSTLYVSIHGEDEFPYYTGSASETGLGEGQGFNLNLPIPTNSSFEVYMQTLKTGLERIKEFSPGFVVVSLGFDTFHLDPLGKFEVETGDYGVMAREVRRCISDLEGEVKCVILLEGGYVIQRLGENLLSFLRGWEEL
jgi:acetoin utilization deacetylase AcuC-like enzyme